MDPTSLGFAIPVVPMPVGPSETADYFDVGKNAGTPGVIPKTRSLTAWASGA
jgi:hypothetical protein